MHFYTLSEVSEILNISQSTIYHNGPANYGGVKIGGTWRFPEDKIGVGAESKPKQINAGYKRKFSKKSKRVS